MALQTQRGGVCINRQGALLSSVAVTWPVHTTGNKRYQVDAAGVPFPLIGRNAWSIIGLSPTDIAVFLDDTVAKGFTSIEVWIPGHYPGSAVVPFDGAGNLPWSLRLDGSPWNGSLSYSNINTDAPDFTTPVTAYWNYAETNVFEACRTRGLQVQVFFAYVGYVDNNEGWMNEMVANGATKCQTYGAYVANRFKTQANLVQMIGGDWGGVSNPFTAPQVVVEQAYINGLGSISGQVTTLQSAEWRHPMIATDQTDGFGATITLNSVYALPLEIAETGADGWAYTPTLPCYLMETSFENQGVGPYRRYAWWGWLATIAGSMMGNDPMFKFASGWEAYLNSPMSLDMVIMATYIKALEWWTLVPSAAVVTAGSGLITSATWIAAAYNGIGSLLVVYRPPAHVGTFTLDMTVMRGTVTAIWTDPTTGRDVAGGSYPNTGTQAFTAPGTNAGGATDWLLRLVA